MRIKFGLAGLMLAVGGFAVACGGGSETAEAPNRPLLRITEFTVKPGQQATFEAAWKQQQARLEQVDSAVAVNVSVNDAGVYRVIRSMGTWENFEAYQQEINALPGEFPAEAFEQSVSSVTTSIHRARPDLGYTPENPRFAGNQLTNEEYDFIKYFFIYNRPGTGRQAEDILRRMAEVRQRHDVDTPVIVTRSVVAPDGPMILIRLHFEDIADSYTHSAEYMAAMGDDFQSLLGEMNALARHIGTSNNVVRRDLSYQPAN